MENQIEEGKEDLAFTGERFMPEVTGQIAFEHLHRYHFAATFCAGKQVLDVACGEGYGSHILSKGAASVVGIDISAEAVAHAASSYGSEQARFIEASAASLPLEDDSVDVVVSFETIEHHDQHEEMLSEIRRVLRPGGLLVMSSPNKQHYSIDPGYVNPYHVKELFRHELIELVSRYFEQKYVYSQRVVYGSLLIAEGVVGFDSIAGTGLDSSEWANGLSRPLYDLVVASDDVLPEQKSTFFELKVHGLDAAAFYGVHLPERVQATDLKLLRLEAEMGRLRENGADRQYDQIVAQLRAQLESLNAYAQQLEVDKVALASHASEEMHLVKEAHAVEVGRLRDSRNEVLSSLSVLGSLVDDVRREGNSDRLSQERRLEGLQSAFEQSRDLLAEVASNQSSDLGEFKAQLFEVRNQLSEAIATEERIRSLERMLAESQEMVLDHIKSAGNLRDEIVSLRSELTAAAGLRGEMQEMVQKLQLSAAEQRIISDRRQTDLTDALARSEQAQRHSQQLELAAAERQLISDRRQVDLTDALARSEQAQHENQQLQLAIAEQRLISEHRERDVELLKGSRSWRYTAWLRKLSGSARRHL